MDDPTIASVIGALKHASIDLVVTLTEEPTARLTQATAADPYFRTVSVVGENQGIAICAGAALSGRNAVFVTGVAGLLVGAWALAQVGIGLRRAVRHHGLVPRGLRRPHGHPRGPVVDVQAGGRAAPFRGPGSVSDPRSQGRRRGSDPARPERLSRLQCAGGHPDDRGGALVKR